MLIDETFLVFEIILYKTTKLLASSNTSLWKLLRYISVVFSELCPRLSLIISVDTPKYLAMVAHE